MERISTHQFMTMSAAVLMGTTFLPIASIVTESGGRDGWMSVLPAFSIVVPYSLMVLSLVERYPQKNLLQISETLLGKWIGKIIGVLYIFITGYFGHLALSIVFLGIALQFTKGSALIQEIGFVDNYLILPFASVWILMLWGVSSWKKGTGVQ